MSYKRLGLRNGDILSDSHLSYIEDGISDVVNSSDLFKEKVSKIVTSKGIPTFASDSLDKITHNINMLGPAIKHNDEIDKDMIDIRELAESGKITLLCTDERSAMVRFYVWTKDGSQFSVDWGDGVVNNYNNGALASHTYKLGSGAPYKNGNTQFVAKISSLSGLNSIKQFKAYDKPEILWFVSKDVYFENINAMFSFYDYADDHAPRYMKYVDAIGGSLASKGCSAKGAFRSCLALERITGTIDLSTATDTSCLFYNCRELVSIPSVLDLSSSADTSLMFRNCYVLPNIPSVLNLANSRAAQEMFADCRKLRAVPENLNFENCTNLYWMFGNCKELVRVPELKNTKKVTNAAFIFQNCEKLEEVYPDFNMPNCTTMESMFEGCVSLVDAPSTMNFINVENIDEMFWKCSKLKTSPKMIDAPKCKSAFKIFMDCISLEKAPVSITLGAITTNAYSMFENCKNLVSAPVEVIAPTAPMLYSMFKGCVSLEAAETNIVAEMATNVSGLFEGCSSLKRCSHEYSFPEVTNAANLFMNCSRLLEQPNLILPKVTSLTNAFYGCKSLVEGKEYSFPSATSLTNFYRLCTMLEIVGKIECPEATSMQEMLRENASLREVYTIGGPKVNSFWYFMYGSTLSNLTKIPSVIDLSSATDMAHWSLYSGGSSPITNEEVTFIGVRKGIDFYGHPNIKRIRIQNHSPMCENLNFDRCGMNAEALNNLLGDLVVTNVPRAIYIRNNPGSKECDKSIGTKKSWNVITE